MTNKVTFGLEKVHIAFADDKGTTQPAWEAPIHIPGAVRHTPTAVGETSDFYADNGKYHTSSSNNGYTVEVEMALLPDAVKARMLGYPIDDNGAIIEIANATPSKFALMAEVQGDSRNRRFVYYDCQASRTAKENTTTSESKTPQTDVLSLSVSPIEIEGKTMVRADLELSDTNATAYNSFFDEVYVPKLTAGN